jgi:hypothetical protein
MTEPDAPTGAPPKPIKVRRAGGLTIAALRAAVNGGARFVVFPYCESWLIVSFKRASAPTLVKPGEAAWRVGGVQILHSVLFGWWGFPWGPIWTVMTIAQTVRGGVDVTDAVMANLEAVYQDRQLEALPPG